LLDRSHSLHTVEMLKCVTAERGDHGLSRHRSPSRR
jgi:hypothetical protein